LTLGWELGWELGTPLWLGPALGEELGTLVKLGSLVGGLVLLLPVPKVIRIPFRSSVGDLDGVALELSLGVALGAALPLGDELGTSLGALSPSSVGDILGLTLMAALVETLGRELGDELEAPLTLGPSEEGRLKLGLAIGPEEGWLRFTGMVKLLEVTAKGTAISLPTTPGPLSLASLDLDSTDVTVTVTVMSPVLSLPGRTFSEASAASMSAVLPVKVTWPELSVKLTPTLEPNPTSGLPLLPNAENVTTTVW
jgi:hypothetical protein